MEEGTKKKGRRITKKRARKKERNKMRDGMLVDE